MKQETETPQGNTFGIMHTTSQAIHAVFPAENDLMRYAVLAFGYVLNTPERRNRWYSATEFADAIEDTFDPGNARVMLIVRTLRDYATQSNS